MTLQDCHFSSISKAKEYLLPFRISGFQKANSRSYDTWVLWSHNPDENSLANYCSIEERIRRFLIKYEWHRFVQFWAVKKIAGSKCLLTTTHQPFYYGELEKGYCSYQKECMRRNIDVGPEADESQLGPVGRAYRTGFVEICPDITLYTIQEFPLRDHAILCGLDGVVAIPVFDLANDNIVGVLGFLYDGFWSLEFYLNPKIRLEEVGLQSYYRRSSSGSMDWDKYPENIVREINKMFKEVAKTHPLALGLALAPCYKEDCLSCSGTGSLDNQVAVYRNCYMNGLDEFIKIYNIYGGMGVSGRAFASSKSCFCRDIRNLSLLNYPYGLYARHIGLTFSVATCIEDGNNNNLVLEFFLLPGCYSTKCIRLLSRSLLAKIKELLSSYKVADEDFPGEELFPNTYDSLKHDEIHCMHVCPNPLSLSVAPTSCCVIDDDQLFFDNDEAVVVHFSPAKLSCENVKMFEDGESSDNALVLWSHDTGKHHVVEERIKLVFKHLIKIHYHFFLLQFWAPRRIADRSFLTTSDQPFALVSMEKVFCLYRKECTRQNIYVDEEGNYEMQLGPAGRVFKNGVAESSPHVPLYTIQEFPLRDYAVLCGIGEVVWLPVFHLGGKHTVGVLEIIINPDGGTFLEYLTCLTKELKRMGLRIDYVDPESGKSDSPAEVKNMFEAISATHPLLFARASIPSQGDYCLSNFIQEAHYTNPISYAAKFFRRDYVFKTSYLHQSQDKYGVAGKALESRRSCFCMNICNLGIYDYPLAHYAKHFGLSFCVAICVQNTQFVDKICVLELFLLPCNYSSEYIGGLLDSLLMSVKQHLPNNFKILSEDVPGEPLFIEIGIFLENGSKGTSNGVHVADGRETNFLVPQDAQENIYGMHLTDNVFGIQAVNGREATSLVIQGENISETHIADGTEATRIATLGWINMHVDGGIEVNPLVPQGENITTMPVAGGTRFTRPIAEGENNCSRKLSKRQRSDYQIQVGLDVLKHEFGKPLDEAAKNLGVSRSTLKRMCRSRGILKWPYHEKHKVNHSLFIKEKPGAAACVGESPDALGNSERDSSQTLLPNQTCIELTPDIQIDQHQTSLEGDKFVTIKASYGDDVLLKFRLNRSSGLEDLKEEVAKRLKVQAGRCNMKYQDEDGEWISITIDEDLQSCLQTLATRTQTTIRMSVHLN